MSMAIERLLSSLDIHPVLLDIGASGSPPKIWESIAPHSTYIGFDPDAREIHEIKNSRFGKATIVNEAVVSAPDIDRVDVFLTASPYCSSTLEPDQVALANYLFSDLFRVEKRIQAPATSLNTVIERLALPGIDWFKTDSQGIDLRLFNSLKLDVRSRVLAVDVEPGLIDAYVGEDLFVDAHRELTRQGFWLSRMEVKGAVRMRRASLDALPGLDQVDQNFVAKMVRPSPGWCEARYLRTLDWMMQHNLTQRDYALLWVFALLDEQFGFALDVGVQSAQVFGEGNVSQVMRSEPVALMKQIYQDQQRAANQISTRLTRRIRKIWNG